MVLQLFAFSLSTFSGRNLGDITAKMTTQSIAASLAGTALGIVASHYIGASFFNVVAAFIPLSALRFFF
jgi:hypothetical protein